MDVEMDEIACHGVDGRRRRYGFQMAKDSRIIALDGLMMSAQLVSLGGMPGLIDQTVFQTPCESY